MAFVLNKCGKSLLWISMDPQSSLYATRFRNDSTLTLVPAIAPVRRAPRVFLAPLRPILFLSRTIHGRFSRADYSRHDGWPLRLGPDPCRRFTHILSFHQRLSPVFFLLGLRSSPARAERLGINLHYT